MEDAAARIERRLIDSLYVEAMLLADEARAYFDESGRTERDTLDPMMRVSFSCESLKITTRLMHVIAWLLTQRAVAVGELSPRDALDRARRLGDAPASDAGAVSAMPTRAQAMIRASVDLHRRTALLDHAQAEPTSVPSPARSMIERLSRRL